MAVDGGDGVAAGTPGESAPVQGETGAPVVTPRRKFPKFEKLFDPIRRFMAGDESDAVRPAGTVNRVRHRQPRVFFICTGNATRSQMAEAWALKEDLYAESGGTFPAAVIPTECIEVMQEKGIDISQCRPKLLDPSRLGSFDRVVVMGAQLPDAWREGVRSEEWEALDPRDFPLDGYRLVRDDLEKRVARLAKVLKGSAAAKAAKAAKAANQPPIAR